MPKDTRSVSECLAQSAYLHRCNRQKATVRLAVCSGDDGQPAGFAQWQAWALKVFIRANAGKSV